MLIESVIQARFTKRFHEKIIRPTSYFEYFLCFSFFFLFFFFPFHRYDILMLKICFHRNPGNFMKNIPGVAYTIHIEKNIFIIRSRARVSLIFFYDCEICYGSLKLAKNIPHSFQTVIIVFVHIKWSSFVAFGEWKSRFVEL